VSLRLTKAQRAALRGKFGGRCAYCGCELGDRWHADHLESVQRELAARGGRLVPTGKLHRPENDRLENFMPSCAPCNLSKHSMPLEGWRDWLAGHLRSLNAHHPIYRLVKAYGLVVETGKPVTFYFERYSAEQEAA
jgi:5-methylcytosine-specific restriction endonuclease McrA